MGEFRVVEEIALADCALDIEGQDEADLFETAARALAELMVDPATISPGAERRVHLVASSLDLLLHDWLSELIFHKDRDCEVFTDIEVHVTRTREGAFELEAHARGGVIDRARTALRADPKAVTFHHLAVTRSDDQVRARVVIDI